MFGSTANAFGNSGSTPFGSTAAPSNTGSSPFGTTAANSAPAFGANNSTNAASGFGGFGASANSNPSATSAGLFGMSNNNNNSNSGNAATPFGQAAPVSANPPALFGSSASPANSAAAQGSGTAIKPFAPYTEKDATTGSNNVFQSISCMPEYRAFSFEELRFQDYQANRRFPGGPTSAAPTGVASPFGAQSSSPFAQNTGNPSNTNVFGMLGSNNANNPAANTGAAGLFGQNNNNNNNNNSLFGAANTGAANSPYGMNKPASAGGLFGQSSNNAGGLFGQTAANNNQPSGGGLFGQNTNNTAPGAGGIFGGAAANTTPGQPSGGLFGQSNTAGGGLFGQNNANNSPFGQNNAANKPAGGGLFGQNATTTANSPFGQPAQQQAGSGLFGNKPANSGGLFGQPNNTAAPAGGLFGQTNNATNSPFGQNNNGSGGLFGQNNANNGAPGGAGGLFGQTNTNGGGLFGQNNNNNNNTNGGLFGQSNNNNNASGGLFGQNNTNNTTFGQNSSSNSAFGQPQQGNSLFGAKPAGGSGLFGQNQNTSTGFGQTSTTGGLFGQNANNNAPGNTGGLFGQNNTTNTGGGLFGQTNNQPQQAQQQPGGGLFGQNTNQQTQGGLFGQNNTNTGGGLFGQNNNQQQQQQQQQQSGGLFGAKPAGGLGGGGGGLFGQNNTQQQQPAGGLFGQNNNTNNSTGGGLFGSKPAGSTGGGLFGQNNGTSTTGSGSLFGQNNSTTSNTTGGGLFGAKPAGAAPSGGLFGAKPAGTSAPSGGLFGAKPAGTATSGGLFGAKPAGTSSGGLFGNTSTTNNGNAQGTSQGGLFGGQQNQQPAAQGPQPALQQANTNPYGTNELFSRVIIPSSITQPNKPSAIKLNADMKKKASLSGAYKLAPKPLFAPRSSSTSPVTRLGSEVIGKSRALSVTSSTDSLGREIVPANTGASSIFTNDSDELILSSNNALFNPDKKSFKNLIINRKKMEETADFKQDDDQVLRITFSSDGDSVETGERQNVTKITNADTPVFDGVQDTPLRKDNKLEGLYKKSASTPLSKNVLSSSTIKGASDTSKDINKRSMGSIGDDISFTDDGYYMTPSLETLSSMTLLQLRKVSGLTIGHRDYGKIEFLEPVDLSNVSLPALCGQLVVFEPKTCSVCPSSSSAPAEGEGLNVRARISTFGCFPVDKSTRKPIKDPNHPIIKRHINRLKAISGTRFDSYDPQTGTWVFTVDSPV